MKASEVNFDLLLPFRVPQESVASDASPLRIEAEMIRAGDRGPLTLRGYVLLPVRPSGNEAGGKQVENDEPAAENVKKPREYVKIPFGAMDVVAPLEVKKPFLMFPYEDARAVRKRVKTGDVVWVGVEALALVSDDEREPKKLDIDIKVRRLLSW